MSDIIDIKEIRKKFPIFKNKLIYLDSAATTQRPDCVIDAITNFYTNYNATVHRGVYELSELATQNYENTREKVAKFINAKKSSEIIFTSGTTESINFICDASIWGNNFINSGDEILITQLEHHANLLPWQRLAKRIGAKLRFIKIDKENFVLDTDEPDLINSKTKLVSIIHSSNVLGKVWLDGQLKDLINKAHAVGARVLLDSAQFIPHERIDVQDLDVDFVAFSAHKMLGPTGLGVLYIKEELHDSIEPYKVGGSMVFDASFDSAKWDKAPNKYEAGTPPIAQVIGFGAAIDFLNNVSFDKLKKHESNLCKKLVEMFESINSVKILGNKELLKSSGHLVTFTVKDIHAHDIAGYLGANNIAVRAGHHCVQPFVKLMGMEASVRASIYVYNNCEDIDLFIEKLKEAIKVLS